MMKQVILLVFAAAIFCMVAGCKKDSSNKDQTLVGIWANKQIYPNATGRLSIYSFTADGQYTVKSGAFDPVKDQTLGYSYKETGTYALTGQQLSLNTSTVYTITDATKTIVPETELVTKPQVRQTTYDVGYSTKKDSLSLLINCPPNANCIGLLWYKKQ